MGPSVASVLVSCYLRWKNHPSLTISRKWKPHNALSSKTGILRKFRLLDQPWIYCYCISDHLRIHCYCISDHLRIHCYCISDQLRIYCYCISDRLRIHCYCICVFPINLESIGTVFPVALKFIATVFPINSESIATIFLCSANTHIHTPHIMLLQTILPGFGMIIAGKSLLFGRY